MPNPDQTGPHSLHDFAAGDPVAFHRYIRSRRDAHVAATASALLTLLWSHIKQWFAASRRSRNQPAEKNPLTSAAKAVITNLTAMR